MVLRDLYVLFDILSAVQRFRTLLSYLLEAFQRHCIVSLPGKMKIFNRPSLSSRYREHPRSSAYWQGKRREIALSILIPFAAVQLLVLGLQAYILGSAFGSENRVRNLHVLAVDYDQGTIGKSLNAAYERLEGQDMLGLKWRSPQAFPNVDDIQQAVRDGKYWAGVWTYDGASDRLVAAIGSNVTAQTYDATKAIGYVYNQARYPTISDGDVISNLRALIAASRIAYNGLNGTQALASIQQGNTASLAAVLDPIESTEINIAPLRAGSRVFFNTVEQVFVILLQFFFLMGFKGVIAKFDIEARLTVKHQAMLRGLVSLVYTFCGSLLVASMIYAFRANTPWSGAQYVLLWMAIWLHMHVCFLIFEVVMTFLPMALYPFFVISFVIVSVTSTILPFDVSPGFYRWAFAVPSHELYSIMITIMSGGANNNLDIALSVLFAWWIIFLPLATFAMFWRCNRAAQINEEIRAAIDADLVSCKEESVETQESSRRELVELALQKARSAPEL